MLGRGVELLSVSLESLHLPEVVDGRLRRRLPALLFQQQILVPRHHQNLKPVRFAGRPRGRDRVLAAGPRPDVGGGRHELVHEMLDRRTLFLGRGGLNVALIG